MKKAFLILSALVILSLLAACGAAPASTETTPPVSDVTEPAPVESAAPAEESQPVQSSQPLVIGQASQEPASDVSQQASTPSALNEDDFVVIISGGELTFDMPMDSVFEMLGTEYEYAEAVSCAYDGMDKTFTYPDYIIYSWPDGEVDKVSEFLILSDACMTSRGITVGSTVEEVTAAYGQGASVGSMVEYQAIGRMISFNIVDGVVSDIDFMTVQDN